MRDVCGQNWKSSDDQRQQTTARGPDAQSLNELKAKAGEDPAANIRPVARQVEGMFVQMMLKSMRDALPKDGLFSSEHTRLYTSMYDQQIAQQMTAGKGPWACRDDG